MLILLLATFSSPCSILGTYLWTELSHAAFYANEHRSSCPLFSFLPSDTLLRVERRGLTIMLLSDLLTDSGRLLSLLSSLKSTGSPDIPLNFLLLTVPPLARAPLVLSQGEPNTNVAAHAVEAYNDALQTIVADGLRKGGSWVGVFPTGPVFDVRSFICPFPLQLSERSLADFRLSSALRRPYSIMLLFSATSTLRASTSCTQMEPRRLQLSIRVTPPCLHTFG
jgi:hypothetical protein